MSAEPIQEKNIVTEIRSGCCPKCHRAADTIDSLRAHNALLRKALKEVREAIRTVDSTYMEASWNPDAAIEVTFTIADARLIESTLAATDTAGSLTDPEGGTL